MEAMGWRAVPILLGDVFLLHFIFMFASRMGEIKLLSTDVEAIQCGEYFCAAWGCETTGDAYWKPSSSWDKIIVRHGWEKHPHWKNIKNRRL